MKNRPYNASGAMQFQDRLRLPRWKRCSMSAAADRPSVSRTDYRIGPRLANNMFCMQHDNLSKLMHRWKLQPGF
eukprot:jgi/Chrzof1/14803/Cz09g16220.t1